MADAHYANVIFQFAGDGALADIGPLANALTAVGGAALAMGDAPYLSRSLSLAGAGDWVECAGHALVLGAGDYCVECWLKTTDSNCVPLDFYGNNGWQFFITPAGKCAWYSSSLVLTGTATVNDGQWHHIAFARAAGTLRLFVDGVQNGSVAHTTSYLTVNTKLAIGAQVSSRNATYDTAGKIAEVRITRGVARYTANFSPAATCKVLAGSVADAAGGPAIRTVRACQRESGKGLLSTASASDGAWRMVVPDLGECMVVCLDDAAGPVFNDLIYRATPV